MAADTSKERSRAHGRQREPWPWILVGLLSAMIGSSLLLLWIAIAHPDPLVDGSEAPGRGVAEGLRAPSAVTAGATPARAAR
ncbi:MAG TPA: hypothetical protein VMW35_15765 [Myxococcota bacterium]|nr:hypothetical protein [Myxococcota bacterium]